jgi:uncharacterized protein
MFINVKELERRPIEFRERFATGAVDVGPDASLLEPLATSGRAELLEENRGAGQLVQDIRLVGEFSTRLQMHCARCLVPLERDVKGDFDLIYRPLGVDRKGNEVAIHEADTEIGYYSGEGLQLQDAVKEQVMLAMPFRAICSQECKGLCPQCGRNRNVEACACAPSAPDPRWDALKEIGKKLQS